MSNESRSKLVRGLICVAVGLIIWLLPPPGDLEPVAMHLLGIFIATVLGLILQPMPQGAVVITAVAITAITKTLPSAMR